MNIVLQIITMSRRNPKNLTASIQARLLNISRERNETYQFVLLRYANERFLYRLSLSPYTSRFILKGALLFMAWANDRYRPTRDIDLLGFGDVSDSKLLQIFQEICRMEVEPDGLSFDPDSVKIIEIREQQEYHGKRIQFTAHLGNSRIHLQVDIGIGDAVTPEAPILEIPTLLDLPKPRMRTYPPETVVSEKLQIMVDFGIANSRMKDYYDLFIISKQFHFEGQTLVKAIKNTFNRRRTRIPDDVPSALDEEFANDRVKQEQWKAFLQQHNVHQVPESLSDVIAMLAEFLLPPLKAAKLGITKWNYSWNNGGHWTKNT